jgi:uncharacterized membrane protein YkgB
MPRVTMGAVFLFLGIVQFTPSQHPAMASVFELGIPYVKDWLGLRAFSILLGSLEIFFAFWLWSGRLIRLAGFISMLIGMLAMSFLFTLKDLAWDAFPFLLSPGLGQVLIKDFLFVGIGFFMLFEKRTA